MTTVPPPYAIPPWLAPLVGVALVVRGYRWWQRRRGRKALVDCPGCGQSVTPAKFCGDCGAELGADGDNASE